MLRLTAGSEARRSQRGTRRGAPAVPTTPSGAQETDTTLDDLFGEELSTEEDLFGEAAQDGSREE